MDIVWLIAVIVALVLGVLFGYGIFRYVIKGEERVGKGSSDAQPAHSAEREQTETARTVHQPASGGTWTP